MHEKLALRLCMSHIGLLELRSAGASSAAAVLVHIRGVGKTVSSGEASAQNLCM